MLEIRFREAVVLKQVVDAIRAVTNEACFACRYEGLSLQCMDDSHVALINLLLCSETFEQYRCDEECSFGVDLNSFHKMVNPLSSTDAVILRKSENEQQLTIIGTTVRGASKNVKKYKGADDEENNDWRNVNSDDEDFGRGPAEDVAQKNLWNRTAVLKLSRVAQESFQIPTDQTFTAQVWLPSSRFGHIIRGNVGVAEIMKIIAKPNSLEFSADADIGCTSVVLEPGRGELRDVAKFPWHFAPSKNRGSLKATSDDSVEMEFAVAYLQKFVKSCPLSDKVQLSLSLNVPLRLKFPIDRGSALEFFLAPKLDETD